MGQVMSLADRLKAKREERGISQSQAARELEVARTAYRLWEMEAARPAPDRWRLVARWLGVTMTTLLFSEGLISDEEAATSDAASVRYAEVTGVAADAATEDEAGTFFEQGHEFLARAVRTGVFTPQEATQFAIMLERIQRSVR